MTYASKELRKDREFIFEIVEFNTNVLYYTSRKIKGDEEIILKAIKKDESALQYASKKLKQKFYIPVQGFFYL